MASSATSICNLALAEVPCAPIQDLNEDSKPAAECRRVYRQAVGELLESSRWTFATRRARLAETDNPRSPAWGHAYILPQDVAVLHAVFAAPAEAGQGYAALPGQSAAPLSGLGGGMSFAARELAFAYERDESRLYTDAPGAVAEYTAADPDEAAFAPLFARALAYDIAARICTALTGDAARKAQFVQLAEQARGRAMAADLNRRPAVIDPVPEALAVR